MKKLLKFRKLNSSGKRLFVQAYFSMMLIRLGLLLLPFSKLQGLIKEISQRKMLFPTTRPITAWQVALAVHRSSKYSPGEVKCLARALTTAFLMSRYGLSYKMNIGVARGEQNNFEAHAWVESDGQVIVGNLPDLSRYAAMSSKGEGLII